MSKDLGTFPSMSHIQMSQVAEYMRRKLDVPNFEGDDSTINRFRAEKG